MAVYKIFSGASYYVEAKSKDEAMDKMLHEVYLHKEWTANVEEIDPIIFTLNLEC